MNMKRILAGVIACTVMGAAFPMLSNSRTVQNAIPAMADEVYETIDSTYDMSDLYIGISLVRPPDKTVYAIGEEFDITGARFDGFENTTDPEGHTLYGDWFSVPAEDFGDDLTIDTSRFDNTTPGVYSIYVTFRRSYRGIERSAETTIQVTVQEDNGISDPTEPSTVSSEQPVDPSAPAETPTDPVETVYSTGDDVVELHLHVGLCRNPDKMEYAIGEEFDISGARFEGSMYKTVNGVPDPLGDWFDCDAESFGDELIIDTSQFDNTTPGTYPIFLTIREGYGELEATSASTIQVTVHAPLTVTKYGDVNCDGVMDIADVVLLNKNLMIGTPLSAQGKLNADVDLSDPGQPDETDALNILRAILNMITLPTGEQTVSR